MKILHLKNVKLFTNKRTGQRTVTLSSKELKKMKGFDMAKKIKEIRITW